MRVLLASDFYPPRPGGLEAHVARLARGLRERHHEVTVAAVGSDPPARDPAGVLVHQLPLSLQRIPGVYQQARPFHPPWVDRRFYGSLLRIAAAQRADVIHAHGWCAFSAAAVGSRLGVPVVVTLHDYGLLCPSKSLSCHGEDCRPVAGLCCVRCTGSDQSLAKRTGLAAALLAGRRRLTSRVAHFLAVSTYVAERHRERGLGDGSTLSVVPNFTDLVDSGPTPVPVPGPLLFVGPDSIYKGSQLTQDAYAKLAPAGRGGLHLVGGAAAAPEGDVLRLGRRSAEPLWESFRAASAVAVTPLWPDPCPTVALEAMVLGRPVVATAVGGLTDIVRDGVTGLLVPPRNPTALAEAFRTLQADPHRAQQMGDAGRARVARRFSSVVVVPQIERIYDSVQP
jgi:glycosyltransferase involved in cell wall biosynthesis